ncbi:unnamed protein product [Calypogeia fissa]
MGPPSVSRLRSLGIHSIVVCLFCSAAPLLKKYRRTKRRRFGVVFVWLSWSGLVKELEEEVKWIAYGRSPAVGVRCIIVVSSRLGAERIGEERRPANSGGYDGVIDVAMWHGDSLMVKNRKDEEKRQERWSGGV